MKIAYIGSYPPRECGIGTFTQNLFTSTTGLETVSGIDHEAIVIAMNDLEDVYDYPEEVQFTIQQEQQGDYIEAASFINLSGADVCVPEHESGIFGGQNGAGKQMGNPAEVFFKYPRDVAVPYGKIPQYLLGFPAAAYL